MAPEPVQRSTHLSHELAALGRAIVDAERDRERRLQAKLAELDAWMAEASRIQKLITGGAARREARLRALEDTVEAIAAERARLIAPPRPLDVPPRRFDASVVDMRAPRGGRDDDPD